MSSISPGRKINFFFHFQKWEKLMHVLVVDAQRFVNMPLSSLAGIFIVVVVVVIYNICINIFFVVMVILFLLSFWSVFI